MIKIGDWVRTLNGVSEVVEIIHNTDQYLIKNCVMGTFIKVRRYQIIKKVKKSDYPEYKL